MIVAGLNYPQHAIVKRLMGSGKKRKLYKVELYAGRKKWSMKEFVPLITDGSPQPSSKATSREACRIHQPQHRTPSVFPASMPKKPNESCTVICCFAIFCNVFCVVKDHCSFVRCLKNCSINFIINLE